MPARVRATPPATPQMVYSGSPRPRRTNGALRTDGTRPASTPPAANVSGGSQSAHAGSCAAAPAIAPRNGSTPARSPATPKRTLESTVRINSHVDHAPAVKQCFVGAVLGDEAERQRHPGHRQRRRATGEGRDRHRAA